MIIFLSCIETRIEHVPETIYKAPCLLRAGGKNRRDGSGGQGEGRRRISNAAAINDSASSSTSPPASPCPSPPSAEDNLPPARRALPARPPSPQLRALPHQLRASSLRAGPGSGRDQPRRVLRRRGARRGDHRAARGRDGRVGDGGARGVVVCGRRWRRRREQRRRGPRRRSREDVRDDGRGAVPVARQGDR